MRHLHNGLAAALRSFVMAGLAVALLAASTASAGAADKEIRPVVVVIKAALQADAAAAAGEYGGVVTVLDSERNLYETLVQVEVDVDDPADKIDQLTYDLGKETGIDWAVARGNSVAGDRMYVWTEGRQKSKRRGSTVAAIMNMGSTGLATGAGQRVAILDTGFDMDHPLLIDKYAPGIDLVDGDTHPSDIMNGIDDDGDGRIDEAHGHGTYVAGIVAQTAPAAKIIPIRVLEADGSGELYRVVDGIDEAIARGATVINISFSTAKKDKALEAAVKRARDAGVVVVAAAGNRANEVKQYPAAFDKVIAVGAYDQDLDGVATWGSFGDWVDVSAPGVALISSRPGGGMGTWSGSSLSAPIVAGQVALMRELNEVKMRKDAEKLVRESADKSTGDNRSKYGLVDLNFALTLFD